MVEVKINAEDYYVADSLFQIASEIDNNDFLDAIYDGITDEAVIDADKFIATFKHIKDEPKKDEPKKEIDLLDKLLNMSCEDFTRFMRSIGVFGDKDYVAEYGDGIGKIITDANDEGYGVYLNLQNLHDYYLYVRFIDSPYVRDCEINGMMDESEDWIETFNLEAIVKDFENELKAFV